MKELLIIIIITGLFACNQVNSKNDKKIMDFNSFTIETPQSWTQIKEKGIDSYVGKIALDYTDTIDFDLGWYSNDLTEYQQVKMGNGKIYYISSYDTAYSPTLVDSVNKSKVVKSNISWSTIDDRRAKILSPIKSGEGITGIYFDSLWQAGSDIDKFNLYGTNLKENNEQALLNAFKTLKFHKSN
ncbi:MAG: hypothetical protein DI598_19250 [Pseudopedobacter saltans]|uniref:Uncharacterized protein n=1 Tax=Pseudopedobacter saltans TaxID=151895 RepID=A0A2W5E8I2_9SPHI|nr:MAG: hypothetical protein DI598_19250 [Pseudopedobacter saltans]